MPKPAMTSPSLTQLPARELALSSQSASGADACTATAWGTGAVMSCRETQDLRIVIVSGRGRCEDPWHDFAATSAKIAETLQQDPRFARASIEIRSTFAHSLEDLRPAGWQDSGQAGQMVQGEQAGHSAQVEHSAQAGQVRELDLNGQAGHPGQGIRAGRDLLVLNMSWPRPGYMEAGIDESPEAWQGFFDRIAAWAASGGAVLAVHATALAAGHDQQIASILGGYWADGISGHPPIGPMVLEIATQPAAPVASGVGALETGTPRTGTPGVGAQCAAAQGAGTPGAGAQRAGAQAEPGQGQGLVEGLASVHAFDERYCRLQVDPRAEVLGWVRDDPAQPTGQAYPALWTYQAHGGRTAYSALGHDARSYASASHRRLLQQAAAWCLGLDGPG